MRIILLHIIAYSGDIQKISWSITNSRKFFLLTLTAIHFTILPGIQPLLTHTVIVICVFIIVLYWNHAPQKYILIPNPTTPHPPSLLDQAFPIKCCLVGRESSPSSPRLRNWLLIPSVSHNWSRSRNVLITVPRFRWKTEVRWCHSLTNTKAQRNAYTVYVTPGYWREAHGRYKDTPRYTDAPRLSATKSPQI